MTRPSPLTGWKKSCVRRARPSGDAGIIGNYSIATTRPPRRLRRRLRRNRRNPPSVLPRTKSPAQPSDSSQPPAEPSIQAKIAELKAAKKHLASEARETNGYLQLDRTRDETRPTGSQCLIGGAGGIRTAGPFWVFCSWETVRNPPRLVARSDEPLRPIAVMQAPCKMVTRSKSERAQRSSRHTTKFAVANKLVPMRQQT